MYRFIVVALALMPSAVLAASATNQPITCSSSTALADADGVSPPAATGTINMELVGGTAKNQLGVVMDITWGTTTTVAGWCEESTDATRWGRIQSCTNASPSVCTPVTHNWAAAAWSAADPVLHVVSTMKYIRCQFWDASSGTGTIIYCVNRLDQ